MIRGKEFTISEYIPDIQTNSISFNYITTFDDGTTHSFSDVLTFPTELTSALLERKAVKRALESVHIILGLSYFKMFIPPKISLPYSLNAEQARFWNTLYTCGAGEFFYTNSLDFRGLIDFPVSESETHPITSEYESSKALILHGGGKDSLVSVEITKTTDVDFDLFSLNTSVIQQIAAEAVGKNLHVVQRKIDPKMFELNASGDAYNGHISITMLYSFIAVLYATLTSDYRYVVTSCEASSSIGNVEYLGIQVNHQWSKSIEAEEIIKDYIKKFVSVDVEYFSLLRPLSEIKIVELFCKHRQYFTKFSSSNHNFQQVKGKPSRWDIEYSRGKVEFVFALFTAFLPREDILSIFEDNFYADAKHIHRYSCLLYTSYGYI